MGPHAPGAAVAHVGQRLGGVVVVVGLVGLVLALFRKRKTARAKGRRRCGCENHEQEGTA